MKSIMSSQSKICFFLQFPIKNIIITFLGDLPDQETVQYQLLNADILIITLKI